jgi:transposase
MLTSIHPQDYDIFVALDVDKKSYAISFKEYHNTKCYSLKMPAQPDSMIRFFDKRFPGKRLVYAYEAGPTGYALYDHVTSKNHDCIMVHPGNLEKAPKDRVKTNRLDSLKILSQLHGGGLKGIRVPSESYRQLRHLTMLRQQYATDQRRAKQRIEALLTFESASVPLGNNSRWSSRHLQLLKELELEPVRRFRLNSLLEDLTYARGQLLKMHRELREFCQRNESIHNNIQLLRSIPGFGFVIPAYLLGRIGDPAHLRSVREIGSFAGVVPSERSTGETVKKGPITHMGDSILRGLLVEGAWIAIRKDDELRQFYERIRSKNRGEKGARIAIVAVARKLAYRAHRVLKDQRPYVIH